MRRPIGRPICHNIKGLARFSGRFQPDLEISDEDLHVAFDLNTLAFTHIFNSLFINCWYKRSKTKQDVSKYVIIDEMNEK